MKLGINKPNTNIQLYGYKHLDHVKLYQLIFCLVSHFDATERRDFIFNLTSNQLRDINSKIYAKGK